MADLRLGALLDASTKERTDQPATIATDDLATHGVIVGMTGSGKTGLGVGLIEECLAAGVPTLLVDPKGDLTNLCLLFETMDGPTFQPWVDEAAARKAGLDVAAFAEQQATAWRTGLESWGIAPDHVAALRRSVDIAVYTPGSSAGLPLNVLGSLAPPPPGLDAEVVQDEVSGWVSGVLGLLGIAADPVTSREHILLSSIVSDAWGRRETLDLAGVITRIQQPPFRKLGVLELDQVIPAADRAALALRLNGLLAAPGFSTWLAGDPIDIASMMRTADGRPRCAVVTLAHLSDEQRLSTTALLLSKVVTWMRSQSGTSDLRLLLYLDEVAGYLPPVANPATKPVILLLMKQARAFGVGVVLATQNPVDVDYKALSNAGTWLVGRLQTEQDKARLLDGLSSAAGNVDMAATADAIAGLGKRQFLLREAGSDTPRLMTTRWAMSYLRGPMTREEIAALKQRGFRPTGQPEPVVSPPSAPVPAPPSAPAPAPASTSEPAPTPSTTTSTTSPTADDESPVMPAVAKAVGVRYVDPAAPWAAGVGAVPGGRLEAAAVARVHLRYDEAKVDFVHDEEYEAVLHPLSTADTAGLEQLTQVDFDERDLLEQAPPGARYVLPDARIDTATWWRTLERSLVDLLVRSRTVDVPVNRTLKLAARPGETPEQFQARCRAAADAAADKATAALEAKARRKVAALHQRLDAARTQLAVAEDRRSQTISADVASTVGSMLGGLFGGRQSRASVTAAARRAQTAQDRVSSARLKADELADAVAALEAEIAADVAALEAEWAAKAADVDTLSVPLERSDVRVDSLRLAWLPVGP
jgi:hypothetical protein